MPETKDVATIIAKVRDYKRVRISFLLAEEDEARAKSLKEAYAQELLGIKVTDAEVALYEQIVELLEEPKAGN